MHCSQAAKTGELHFSLRATYRYLKILGIMLLVIRPTTGVMNWDTRHILKKPLMLEAFFFIINVVSYL